MAKLNLPEAEVSRLYLEGLSIDAVAAQFDVSDTPVKKILRRLGIMRLRKDAARTSSTKFIVNERFFESIDTPEQCWALGWFYSDGYNREEAADVRISLNIQDTEVLNKLSTLMGNTRPILHEPRYNRSTLIISRRKVSEDLARLGCTQAKSLTIQFPHQTLDTRAKVCAFLRGFVEGDGSIYVANRNGRADHVALTIACASPRFVKALDRLFQDYWGLKGCIQKNHERPVVGIRFTGTRTKMLAMLREIYDLSLFGLYLERKYQKCLEVVALLEEWLRTGDGRSTRYNDPKVSGASSVYRASIPPLSCP